MTDWLFDSTNGTDSFSTPLFSDPPAFNIDGTPMCGTLDMNGNPYGITSSSYDPWA